MNYQKIYDQLMQKRKQYPLYKGGDVYCEKHHIKPRSLGGGNECDNLINLTAREHYIAHCLLVKIAEQLNDHNMYNRMIRAWNRMRIKPSNGQQSRLDCIHVDSKLYEVFRKKFIERNSGINNSFYGKVVVRDKCNNILVVEKTDPRYVSGELISYFSGRVMVKDKAGNIYHILKTDPRYISGELVPIWLGRKHSEQTKAKYRETFKRIGHQQGSKNSQYGKSWFYNLELKQNIRIYPNQFDEFIKSGWVKGRKMNFS